MSIMTEFVTSTDGTRVAYDRHGSGPAVILVGGAMQFRGFDPETVQLAADLAERGFTVLNYDRRGRGETSSPPPYDLAGEIEDLRALVESVGGEAALYGSSSGGAICLAAAAAGVPVTKLVLWEVPLDAELGSSGAEDLAGLRAALASDNPEAPVEHFMRDMPPEWLEGSKRSPGWPTMVALGPSLAPDSEALAWTQSAPRRQLFAAITVPVLVLIGTDTLPIFPPAADSLVETLPDARLARVAGAQHRWQPAALLDALTDFLRP